MKKILIGALFSLVVAAILVVGSLPGRMAPKSDSEVYNEILPSLVVIRGLMHLGSGVVIKSDELGTLILTNKHVCLPHILPPEVSEEFYNVPEYMIFVMYGRNADKMDKEAIAQVVKVSQNTDLCLLHVNIKGLKPAKISQHPAEMGDKLYNCGTPFGVRDMCFNGIAANYTYELLMLYQMTSVPANPGQSGSGVYNEDAELVGMISIGGAGMSGIVPLSIIKAFLEY